MRLAQRLLVEQEQLAQIVSREVSFCVFLLVDYAGGESLFLGLALEDLLFDCAGGDEAVDEACSASVGRNGGGR